MRKCPADDFTLVPENYEGVTIDRCPHCQGVWLDEGELEVIQDNQDSDYRDVSRSALTKASRAIGMAEAASESVRKCVTCQDVLVKRSYGMGSQVMIDNCPNGHGLWLDRTELSTLQSFYENEQDFANFAEIDIMRELKEGGVKRFFTGLLDNFKS